MNKFIGIATIGLSIFTINFAFASTSSPTESTGLSSGNVTFTGEVVQSTCDITVINSKGIANNNNINLGVMKMDQEHSTPVTFYLKPNASCAPTYKSLKASISWTGDFGTYGLKNDDTGKDAAKGVSIRLQANANNAKLITNQNLTVMGPLVDSSKGYEFGTDMVKNPGETLSPGKVSATATYNVSYE